MNPKSGKAGNAVTPVEPEEVHAADQADPGKMAEVKKRERELKQGKYGSVPVKPLKSGGGGAGGGGGQGAGSSGGPSPGSQEEEKVSWVEIEMVDDDGQPVPGVPYEVTVPDGSVATGTLDENGFARIDGIDPGECKIKFPTLDKEAWERA